MKTIFIATVVCIGWQFSLAFLHPVPSQEEGGGEAPLDVNDVAYLWPVPKTKDDVDVLISLEDKLADKMNEIVSKDAFTSLIDTAQTVAVTNSAGGKDMIEFTPFKEQFSKRSTWKIVAFRIDPSAPGTSPKLIAAFGSTPQVRLIAQPVTVNDAGVVNVHDVTIHLVYAYVKPSDRLAAIAIPDKEWFAEIVRDLRAMKTFVKIKGVETGGKLNVHPGLNSADKEFRGQVKGFLAKHFSGERLHAMAFMGLRPPEPWIFFAMRKKDDVFVRAPNPSFDGDGAQMLTFRGGTPVMPTPKTKNVDGARGVSTASLFAPKAKDKLGLPAFGDLVGLKHKHIPDLIANPQRAHFLNTDCVSCHTESSRRKVLEIADEENEFRHKLPAGISGVAADVLPKDKWNVRNLGWFPSRAGPASATATMRTANEAAESAEFINKEYSKK
jgi:hypothetical protein